MSSIFKYFGNSVVDLVFDREGYCGLKCSYPKDYNDPYELFLAVDFNMEPNLLAFYNDVVNNVRQRPTTCFSNSPVVTPMWAHYGGNHTGFAIEFDLETMQKTFDGCPIWDVDYKDEQDNNLYHMIQRAAGTLKPRHSMMLSRAAFQLAYFTKYTQWQYENEVRFVDTLKVTETVDGHIILYVPYECIKSIICGYNASEELVSKTKEIAENKFLWYKLIIGKSNPLPFFKDANNVSYIFKDGGVINSENICDDCGEPLLTEESSLCPWCKITEEDQYEAQAGNPLRMLDSMGALDSYARSWSTKK